VERLVITKDVVLKQGEPLRFFRQNQEKAALPAKEPTLSSEESL